MKKTILLPILAILFSCSTPETTEEQTLDLYPTEVCQLTYYGNGKLLLIDKNHSVNDTIVNTYANGYSDIDLIVRGYYELKVINCTHATILLTNSTKEIVNFNGTTNGVLYQFFNK